MKVVILATAIGPNSAGAGQYARQLLPRLVPLLAARGCRVSLILSKGGALPAPADSAKIIRLPEFVNRKLSRVLLEHICPSFLTWKADVFFSLDSRFPLGPVWAKQKLVFMHDIQVLRHAAAPGEYPMDRTWATLAYTSLGMRKAIRTADGLIVDSHFIARELKEFAGVSGGRIFSIPCGLDHGRFRPVADPTVVDELRSRYSLPQPFYLFVGQPSTQKNLRLIIQAYASGRVNRDLALPVIIVWDMRRRELFRSTLDLIERARLADLFRFVGYVPDEDLPTLYAAARALLFPSLYEGFGLPPLEAMACGTPVVASNRASLPEVVVDAALLIDPHSKESLAEALREVNDEPIRKRLVEKGLERAQAFSWERTAEQLIQLILG